MSIILHIFFHKYHLIIEILHIEFPCQKLLLCEAFLKMKKRKIFLIIRLSLYIAFIVIFAAIPCSFVEQGSICLIQFAFHVSCPTCGVTRGVSNIFHGNFLRAWTYNPLSYLVVILLFTFLFSDLLLLMTFLRTQKMKSLSLFERLWSWIFPQK